MPALRLRVRDEREHGVTETLLPNKKHKAGSVCELESGGDQCHQAKAFLALFTEPDTDKEH